MNVLPPGNTVGAYAVERLLGTGGCASVYLAEHATLGAKFALKVVHAPQSSLLPRLLREGRLQSTLRHPNVISVFDVLEWNGSPVLVMDYVDGPSLLELLVLQPLALDHVDRIAIGLFRGVRAAHRAGLVHRDLKPANILFARTEGELVPKIGDFGLAKVLSEGEGGMTRAGQVFGTPGYMAPEQFRDARSVDERADLFSLGCILYEMIAGQPPYTGTDLLELYARIQRGDRVDLATTRPSIPPRMLDAVNRCLEADRQLRPRDVDELFSIWFDDPTGEHTGSMPVVPSVPIDVTDEQLRSVRSRASVDRTPSVVPRHLTPDRLAAHAPSATEQAHLDECVRCRVDRRRLLSALSPTETTTSLHPVVLRDLTAPDLPPEPSRLWGLAPWVLAAVAVLVAGYALWPSPSPTGVHAVERPAPVAELPGAVAELPRSVTEPPAPLAEPPAVVAEPPAPVVESPAVAPNPVVTPAPQPRRARTVPAPAPPVEEVPPPPPPPPAPATVTVSGNARSVVLIDEEGRRRASGELPAGTYRVRVQFDLHGQVELDDPIDLQAGAAYELRCLSAFAGCRLVLRL